MRLTIMVEVPNATRFLHPIQGVFDETNQIIIAPIDYVGVVYVDLKEKTIEIYSEKDGLFSNNPDQIEQISNGYLISGRHRKILGQSGSLLILKQQN